MDVDADVALVGKERSAGVDSHADLDRICGKVLLRLLRRGYGISSSAECEEERIALRVDLRAAHGAEGLAHDAAMIARDHGIARVAELLQQPGRALDVSEGKGDGSLVPAHPGNPTARASCLRDPVPLRRR
jgi:hypothetical protein